MTRPNLSNSLGSKMRILGFLLLIVSSLWSATNPDISVDVDLGGADAVLVGKTAKVTAELKWPPGDFTKPTGSYAWTVSSGLKITEGQGSSSITIEGIVSELAKVSVEWTASGFDSPSASKNVKVIGIGLLAWGRIASFTGDMYDNSGNTWIPPGGHAALSATASDLDKVAGVYENDTFEKYEAFSWSATKGTATKNEHASCNYVAPNDASVDTITFKIQDDAKYFPDFSTPTYADSRIVYIYELTGLTVSQAAAEQRFTGNNFVKVTLVEKVYGVRPQIKYEAVDQNGAVAFSSISLSNEQLIKIPKPGRYTFTVTNVSRTSETFSKDKFTFFTLKFSDTSKKFVWEKDELLQGIDKVKAKGEAVDQALDTFVTLAGMAGDGHDYATDYEKVVADSNAAKEKAALDIIRLGSEIDATKQAITQMEHSAELTLLLINATQAKIYYETDPAELERLVDLLFQLKAQHNDEIGQVATLKQTLLSREADLAFAAEVKSVATRLWDTAKELRTTTGSLQGAGKALKGVLESSVLPGVIDVIGVGFTINDLITNGKKYDDLIAAWTNADALQKEYKELLDALTAGRKDPTLKDSFSVTSDPPEIEFSFTGGVSWKTYDAAYQDNDASHLVGLGGSFTAWDAKQNTGSTGTVSFDITAYGNLGYENIGLSKDTGTMRIEAGDWSEDDAIAKVKPVIDAEKAPGQIRYNIFQDILGYFDILLTAVGLFVVWTGIGALVVGLVKLGVGAAQLALKWLEDWLVSSPLEKTLRALYPR